MSDSERHDTENASDDLTRGRAWLVGGALGILMLAALIVAFVIGTNFSDESMPVVDATETTPPELPKDTTGPGKEIFATKCGACHKLADAGTTGTIGPDLDTLAPDAQTVQDAVVNGGAGTGMMPPGLLSGDDLTHVSDYITAATGGG